jgi:hypothetical protein
VTAGVLKTPYDFYKKPCGFSENPYGEAVRYSVAERVDIAQRVDLARLPVVDRLN